MPLQRQTWKWQLLYVVTQENLVIRTTVAHEVQN